MTFFPIYIGAGILERTKEVKMTHAFALGKFRWGKKINSVAKATRSQTTIMAAMSLVGPMREDDTGKEGPQKTTR